MTEKQRMLFMATTNRGKIAEMEKLLSELPYRVLGREDFPGLPEVVEDGKTFAENALKKAAVCASHAGELTLAEDSGLVVDALGGRPGVYSARFAGEGASDEENNRMLLSVLADTPPECRTSRFKTVAVLIDPRRLSASLREVICSPSSYAAFYRDGKLPCGLHVVEGICEGTIAQKPAGSAGFGYDPLFIPCGYHRTFAELGVEEKNSISHRARAMRKLKEILS